MGKMNEIDLKLKEINRKLITLILILLIVMFGAKAIISTLKMQKTIDDQVEKIIQLQRENINLKQEINGYQGEK